MKKLLEKYGNNKVFAGIGVITIVILLIVWFMFSGMKSSFKVVTKKDVVTEYGEDLDWAKLYDADKSDKGVEVKEVKDFNKDLIGDQKITVVFEKGSDAQDEKITVTVKDTVKPEFIDFKDEIVIEQGAENVKLEEYFVAKDKAAVAISVDGDVDLTKTGEYKITVTAMDANKNKTDAKSCVVVIASSKEVADGKKLTATVKGEVPLSKETKEKVDKGEVKINIEKPSENVTAVVKEQNKIAEENKEKEATNNKPEPETKEESKKPDISKENTSNKAPENNKTDSSSTNSKNESNGSSNSNSGSGSVAKPEENKPSHTHDWKAVYKTVHHEEQGHNEKYVIKDAWNEEIPKFERQSVYVCYSPNCGYESGDEDNFDQHVKQHALKREDTSYGVEYRNVQTGTETKHHEAEYGTKWIVDKAAYNEKVLDHYECNCGQTK